MALSYVYIFLWMSAKCKVEGYFFSSSLWRQYFRFLISSCSVLVIFVHGFCSIFFYTLRPFLLKYLIIAEFYRYQQKARSEWQWQWDTASCLTLRRLIQTSGAFCNAHPFKMLSCCWSCDKIIIDNTVYVSRYFCTSVP